MCPLNKHGEPNHLKLAAMSLAGLAILGAWIIVPIWIAWTLARALIG